MEADPSKYHYEVLNCILRTMRKVPHFKYPVVPRYEGAEFCLLVGKRVIFRKVFKSDGELRYFFRPQGREKNKLFTEAFEDYAFDQYYN